jgi:hypothetical protein
VKATAFSGRWALAGQAGPERVRVGPSGSAQTGRIRFCFFFRNIFQRKNKFGNSRKCLQGTKNTSKSPKIPGKFLETHWDMSYPNKVFGAHKKDFRAF